MTHGMLVSSCKRLFVTRNLHAKLLCEDSGSINTNCWGVKEWMLHYLCK